MKANYCYMVVCCYDGCCPFQCIFLISYFAVLNGARPRGYKILSCSTHMRGSRNFRQGGPGQSDKKSSDNVFFFFFFFSPQLILQKSNGQFQRNLSFFKVSEGVQHFPGGGGPTFSRGVQLLISYRNPHYL